MDILPLDLFFCDDEGVLVIPQTCEEEIGRVIEMAETESAVVGTIRDGMSASGAFETLGAMLSGRRAKITENKGIVPQQRPLQGSLQSKP